MGPPKPTIFRGFYGKSPGLQRLAKNPKSFLNPGGNPFHRWPPQREASLGGLLWFPKTGILYGCFQR